MMKKIMLLSLLISGLAIAERNTIEVRVGGDLSGNSKLKYKEYSVKGLKKGLEIGAEYRRDLGMGLEVGAGAFYKKNSYHNEIKEYVSDYAISDGKISTSFKGFHSFPIYATARYNFLTPTETIKPYIKANLGYSINSGKLSSTYVESNSRYAYIAGKTNTDIKFKNGLYYGLGTGLEYNNFSVDLSYNEIQSKFTEYYMDSSSLIIQNGIRTEGYSYKTYDKKNKNRFVTLSFGYSFKF